MEEIQPTLAGCNGRDLTSYQGVTEGALPTLAECIFHSVHQILHMS